MKRKDLTGTRFGHLTVKEMLYGYRGRKTFCRCVCDCGSEKIIQVDNLKRGNQISCGCMTSYYRSLNNRTNEIGMKYNKYKHTLPFDFAVYNNNNELLLLIEYDGQQHFKPVPFYGGDSFLKETQIRDRIKTEYCNNNNIKLLRFNYLDDNKTILNTIINNIYP